MLVSGDTTDHLGLGLGWYVVDLASGRSVQVAALADRADWSADGRSVLVVDPGSNGQPPRLTVVDPATGQKHWYGSMPINERIGMWR